MGAAGGETRVTTDSWSIRGCTHGMNRSPVVFLVVALLAAADAALRLTFGGRASPPDSLWWLFDATRENGLPTWFSVVAMACVGLRCRERASEARWWLLPAAGFLYLSLDDACMVHERLGVLIAPSLSSTGIYAWVSVLGPVFAAGGLIVGTLMWRALRADRNRRVFLLAGFTALGVALGIEALEDKTIGSGLALRGLPLVEYTKWLEESLEMLGPALLLAALGVAAPAAVPAPAFATSTEPARANDRQSAVVTAPQPSRRNATIAATPR